MNPQTPPRPLQVIPETSPMDLEPPETPVGERTEAPTPLMLRFVESSPQQDAQRQPPRSPPYMLPPHLWYDDPTSSLPSSPPPPTDDQPSIAGRHCDRMYIPTYIQYDDLVPAGVEDIWSGRGHARDWAVKTLLNEINLGIYAWVSVSERGRQLPSCARLARLFGLVEEFGMRMEIPQVQWDVEGCFGKVRIGRVDCYYS